MRIMLACCAGMSTSLVVSKMQEAAKSQGKDYKIRAVEQGQIEAEMGNFDVLLLGPQVRHIMRKVQKIVGDAAPIAAIDAVAYGTCDWIGYSYYQSVVTAENSAGYTTVGGNLKGGLKNPNLEATPWGWQIDPTDLRILCNRMYDRYYKPLFILENGIGMIETLNEENTVHDDYRIEYLKEHLRALKQAINDGCDIRGYTWWGPMDVVSSGTREMSKR